MHYNFKSNITIEPRLQEYIRKKRHYREFDIVPSISLEREFYITEDDKKIVKHYLKSNEDLFKPHEIENFTPPNELDQYFPTKFAKTKDPRLKVLNLTKPDISVPKNMGMFADDNVSCYPDEMLQQNLPLRTHSRDMFENSQVKQKTKDLIEDECHNRILGQQHNAKRRHTIIDLIKDKNFTNKTRSYQHPKPKSDPRLNMESTDDLIQHSIKNRVEDDSSIMMQRIIDSQQMHTIPQRKMKQESYLDKQFQPNIIPGIPTIGKPKKAQHKSTYYSDPYIMQGDRNVDKETDMIQGLPSRMYDKQSNSSSYRNPHEHYFDFIGPDIQDPDHVVMEFPRGGYSTRLENKVKPDEIQPRERL